MEKAYKEDLFMILSMNMEVEEALKETDRIANNFKNIYSPKPTNLQPINGNGTYRYFLNELGSGWSAEFTSRVDKYVDGKWEVFMKFVGAHEAYKCRELVNRLQLGGNTIIKY